MLNQAQKTVIYEKIPTNLAGKRWVKLRSYQLSREPVFPRMVITELIAGVRVHYYADQLHKTKYHNWPADVTYGQIDSASFSIVLESEDRAEVEAAAAELQKWLLQESYYDVWLEQRVWFRGIQAAGEIPSLYNERNGKMIYRCNVDFNVHYEVIWPEDADAIRRFDMTTHKDEKAHIKLLTTAANSYTMGIKIVKY